MPEIIPSNERKANQHSFGKINDKVEDFKKHFGNVRKSTYESTQKILYGKSMSEPHYVNISMERDHFRPQPVDINTVKLIVTDLKVTNSVRSDGIPLKFVKDALHVNAFYLTCIVNTFLVTGVLPTAWTHAIVVLFFNGDAENVNTYRPLL